MIKKQSRELTTFEKSFLSTREKIQFAVEVSKPELIPKLIKNFKYYIPGFHLKLEDTKYVYQDNPITLHEIPKSIKTARDACEYISKIDYEFEDTLSIISANENLVAVSVSHMACDGGFFIDIFDKLLLDDQYPLKSIFPLTTGHVLQVELSKVTKSDIQEYQKSKYNLTTLKWSDNFQELRKNVTENTLCKYLVDETAAKDFQFIKSNISLNDSYMANYALSMMALNDNLDSNFGMATCVDMRQLMDPKDRNPSNSQNFTDMYVIAKNVTPKMTIREVAKLFRQDLNQKLKNGGIFTAYQSHFDSDFVYESKNTSNADISNIGRFKTDNENTKFITDTWIQTKNQAIGAEGFVGLVLFSKEKHGVNTLVTRIQQPCSVINDRDAKVLMNSLMHLMKEAPVDISIQEAYDELRRFQRTQ